MSVDTETKRRSAVASGLTSLIILPVPGTVPSGANRMHGVGLYGGIEPGVAVVEDVGWNILANVSATLGSLQDDVSNNSTDWDIVENVSSVLGALQA